MTTKPEIRYEAEDHLLKVEDSVRRIAQQVAPLIPSVTGLALPPHPLIRLVRLPALIQAANAHHQRCLTRGIRSGLDEAQAADAQARIATVDEDIWILSMGTVITDITGRPECLIAPTALAEHGLTDPDSGALVEKIAFSLVHLAHRHSAPQLAAIADSVTLQPQGYDLRGLATLLSGHAKWASRRTCALLDVTTEHTTPPVIQKIIEKFPEMDAVNRSIREEGAAWIEQVLGLPGGEAALAQVWTQPDLAPTTAESADPRAWLRRVQGDADMTPTS